MLQKNPLKKGKPDSTLISLLIEKVIKFRAVTLGIIGLITIIALLQFPRIKVDTDPENMLSAKEPVRQTYEWVKEHFGIRDMLVLGIVRKDGIWKKDSLERILKINEKILNIKGIVTDDVLSFLTTDNVEAGGGLLNVHRIMEEVPQSNEEIRKIKESIDSNDVLRDKLASSDGKGIAMYLPIEKKSESYRISQEIKKIIKEYGSNKEQYYIAGLPVAEDSFGHLMFKQMAISAPLSFLLIFLLMLLFFRKPLIVFGPMIVAMLSIIWTMGLLIGMGFTVHIMSSMIPIFIIPISVLSGIHILSEFHEECPRCLKRDLAMQRSIRALFVPMLFAALTTMVGFASLGTTPIPPVRVFGSFVAFGVFVSWLLSMIFIPLYVTFFNEARLVEDLSGAFKDSENTPFARFLRHRLSRLGIVHYKKVLLFTALLLVIATWGISRIVINDNPVKWFKKGHPIREADRVINKHFGGTYMVYLLFKGEKNGIMKSPRVVRYIDNLQNYLEKNSSLVGKTTSLANVVKRVNFVLHNNDPEYNVVPDDAKELAQYLFLFLMSGNPRDLDKLVDYEYKNTNIWLQLKKGENLDIKSVINTVNNYIQKHPLPPGLSLKNIKWSGLSYINVFWQDKMVKGMLYGSLLSSYIAVFLMMAFLFRSLGKGFLSMVPLTVTLAVIYGFIGLIGKNYDMPIAVLSSMTLGMSIDFAIHFIQRREQILKLLPHLKDVSAEEDMKERKKLALFRNFGAPARAITRNILVISLGFIPLVFAPLVPYITVGIFIAAIMALSGIATLIILPALMIVFKA